MPEGGKTRSDSDHIFHLSGISRIEPRTHWQLKTLLSCRISREMIGPLPCSLSRRERETLRRRIREIPSPGGVQSRPKDAGLRLSPEWQWEDAPSPESKRAPLKKPALGLNKGLRGWRWGAPSPRQKSAERQPSPGAEFLPRKSRIESRSGPYRPRTRLRWLTYSWSEIFAQAPTLVRERTKLSWMRLARSLCSTTSANTSAAASPNES